MRVQGSRKNTRELRVELFEKTERERRRSKGRMKIASLKTIEAFEKQ